MSYSYMTGNATCLLGSLGGFQSSLVVVALARLRDAGAMVIGAISRLRSTLLARWPTRKAQNGQPEEQTTDDSDDRELRPHYVEPGAPIKEGLGERQELR
jgi:hypothetical protein